MPEGRATQEQLPIEGEPAKTNYRQGENPPSGAVHGGTSLTDQAPGRPSLAARDPPQAMTFSHRQSAANRPQGERGIEERNFPLFRHTNKNAQRTGGGFAGQQLRLGGAGIPSRESRRTSVTGRINTRRIRGNPAPEVQRKFPDPTEYFIQQNKTLSKHIVSLTTISDLRVASNYKSLFFSYLRGLRRHGPHPSWNRCPSPPLAERRAARCGTSGLQSAGPAPSAAPPAPRKPARRAPA